ncbi:MAG: WavE lipopolysaccharide synthesis family protein, partial [Acidobacteriota bacterium]|nr:WavE lipopolysaccharide synthesis family protein [Acidobacteriota bacterium]
MTKHSSGNAGETPALHEPTAQVPTLAALVRSDYRLIGWGTGSVFDFYDEHYPLPLRYLIDNDARRHGEQKAGLTIQSSDALTLEDPARTVIVIYSGFWPEISRQIAALGSFQVIPITCLHNREWFQRQIESLNRATAAGIVRRPRSDNAIVIQGPVAPSETALVCRSFAVNYPDDRIILSTWDDTDAALLAEVRPFIDDLVLSRKPEIAGVKNRNLQIVSTRAGLERALQLNCRFAVKTRTDVLVSTGDVLNQCRRVLAQYDSAAAARFGLQGRILIPSSFTRKYLLYHPSDMFMAGNT